MIYFDTDVLIHYLVNQDRKKHHFVNKLYEKTNADKTFFVSLLTLQETAFVLAKIKMESFEIIEKLRVFEVSRPVNYSFDEYIRATELCKKVGFLNINDCLHTAIAESYCTELYTYNQTDFKQIRNHTSLKINILSP
jgi:predicted nucleic acid-binding protein